MQIHLYSFHFTALTLLVRRQDSQSAGKKTGGWFVGGDDLTGALNVLIAVVVTTISITLSSNKIQNGDILVSKVSK